MGSYGSLLTITLLTICCCFLSYVGNAVANPSSPMEKPQELPYEEYRVEHEISWKSAKNVALSTNITSIREPVGCHECSNADIHYCLGADLVSDHCCCDMSYEEVLPYIPHTCYFGKTLCKPILRDCDAYNKLFNCCCNRLTLLKWKKTFSSSPPNTKIPCDIILLIISALLICFY